MEQEVHWRVRPTIEDWATGYTNRLLKVCVCAEHQLRITEQYNETQTLPELYGVDEADAINGLVGYLHYTGLNPEACQHCHGLVKKTVSATGECTRACKLITEIRGMDKEDPTQCYCKQCCCASYANNALHWAILSYVNGFDYNEYKCEACDRASWRDTHDYYKKNLIPAQVVIDLATKNPARILEKNKDGKTPLALIEPLIESLVGTREDEYVKCAEYGWAGHNLETLKTIKKGLMEVLDVYAITTTFGKGCAKLLLGKVTQNNLWER
jgi:hypothetical protein